MLLILKERLWCRDGGNRLRCGPQKVRLPPGTYAAERIPNPESPDMEPWLVVRGTKIGMAERGWRRYTGDRGKLDIVEDAMDDAGDGHQSVNHHRRMLVLTASVETQESIGKWADETFPGAEPMAPRNCIRLLEEVIELCVAAGAKHREIERAVYDELGKAGAKSSLMGGIVDVPGIAAPPEKVAKELADCAIVLDVIAHRRGVNLGEHKDAKMKVNRYEREWIANGDGTGYHKKKDVKP